MGEVTTLKKIQMAVMATIIAMAMGFTLSLGTQTAYADELQASGIDLSAQSQAPAVKNVKQKLIYPGQTITVTLKNSVVGENGSVQDGTWKVTTSNKAVAKVTKYTKASGKSTKVTIKGVKAGAATITANFTNINDMSDKGTVKIKVTGLKKGAAYTANVFTTKVSANASKANTGNMLVTGVSKFSKNKTKYKVPNNMKVNGRTYRVIAVNKKALTGLKAAKVLVIGENVKKLGSRMVSGDKKLKTIEINTTKLTKAKVKNCLAGSCVKTVKVPAKMLAKYKKIFTKANCGKKVTVKSL